MENEEKQQYKKSVINHSQVKEMIGMTVSSAYYDLLEKKVLALIEESKNRAIGNGRRTVLPRDM